MKGLMNMALDYSLIGKRICKARKDKNITQEVLAEKMNVSVAYLSRIECGSTQISLKRVNELCELLNVTEGYILNGVSNTSKNYLNTDFSNLLKNCPREKLKLIYDIASVIVKS